MEEYQSSRCGTISSKLSLRYLASSDSDAPGGHTEICDPAKDNTQQLARTQKTDQNDSIGGSAQEADRPEWLTGLLDDIRATQQQMSQEDNTHNLVVTKLAELQDEMKS